MTEIKAGFEYTVRVFRPDGTEDVAQRETVQNLMPEEGLNHMLDVLLKGGSAHGTWYIGLYEDNYTPTSADTAADFPGDAGEITAEYDEATRQTFTPGTIALGAVDNVGNEAVFTFNETIDVNGGFIVSVSTKGATSGHLVSAVKFGSPKSMTDGSLLTVTAGFTAISA